MTFRSTTQSFPRLLAALAPKVTVDYTLIVSAWGQKEYTAHDFASEWLSPEHLGLKPLATQHLLAQPYFKSVEPDEIVVEWQQLASHGRRGDERLDTSGSITETSDGRSYMEHQFVKIDGRWRITRITPSLIYQTGDFMHIRRPEGSDCNSK